MTKVVKQLFYLNLLVMRFLGFYPTHNYKRIYKLYSFIVYCIFTSLLPILSILHLIIDPNITFDEITDNAFIICQLASFIIKMIPFLINDKEVRKIIYMMEHPIFLTYTRKQEDFINDCKKTCRQMSWFFISCCTVVMLAWCITPLLENSGKFPVDIWLPSAFKDNSKLHCLSFIYVAIGGGHGAVSNGALDPMVATMAYFITTQIKILKDNLLHLNEYAKEHINNNFEGEQREKVHNVIMYNQIKRCTEHHNVIIEFVANYENIFSSVVFTQFSASVFVICICCFRLSQVPLFSIAFMWMVSFLLVMLSEIFLYCYFGTILFEENNTLMQAVYMGNWYEYDLLSQKALITLMERSQRPLVVTAGKILDLSLDTFTTILKRAYSLLAVLRHY